MTSNDISTAFKECLETLNAISQKWENASYSVIARNPSFNRNDSCVNVDYVVTQHHIQSGEK